MLLTYFVLSIAKLLNAVSVLLNRPATVFAAF